MTLRGGIPPWIVVLALALLLGLQPVATDFYLPALPQMPGSLGVSSAAVQWTLSVVVLAFGTAQLIWGPVSDAVGRRPVLLCGLGLFTAASVVTVCAPNLGVLIAGRTAQGLGLAASVVCARAMIRDLYTPEQGAQMLAKGLSGLGVIALVGPLLGGVIAAQWGWRATLALVGVFALATLSFVAWRLPETLPIHRRQPSLSLPARLAQWRSIVRQPMFRAYASLTSATYGGLYIFLASGAFVFIDVLHLSRPLFGGVLASMSLCYLGGTMLCRRWLPRRGLPGTVRMGALGTLSGSLWCLAVSSWVVSSGTPPHAMALLPGMWLYAIGHGLHQPCSQAGVVASFPQQAGAASALSGFIMSVLAFGIGGLLSVWMAAPGLVGTVLPLTLGLGLGGAVTAWLALGVVQRDGHPPRQLAAIVPAEPA